MIKTHLVEEPAAAGITGAAVGDVGEPDGFFWSSSEDSKDVCPVCLRGKPSDSLLEAALVLWKLFRWYKIIINNRPEMIKLRYFCFFRNNNILYRAVLSSRIDVICNKYDDVLNYISYNAYVIF